MSPIIQKLESLLGVKPIPSYNEKELFSRTQIFVQSIRWIPGLQMVAVSNSLAMYATHPYSDIDLFIITTPKRLWIARTLVLLIAELLGIRAKPHDEAGKFCFPFFMTNVNLNLGEIAIENDFYLAYWIQTLKPIFDANNTYTQFIEANKDFSENVLQQACENLQKNQRYHIEIPENTQISRLGDLLSPLLSIIDRFLGYISKKRIAKKIPSEGLEGIIVNENMVKLHWDDKRKEIREKVLNTSP